MTGARAVTVRTGPFPEMDRLAAGPASIALPAGGALPRRSWVQQVMGMPVSVLVRGPMARQAGAERAAALVLDELRRVDALFSTYRDDSEVSRLDRGELDEAACDPLVRQVLALCREARDRTGGMFDALRPGPDGRHRLDPSGLVKGWAAERASRHLAALTGQDWILNAGGDVVLSASRASLPWRVGVEDPLDRQRVVAVVPLAAGGLATSGGAARGDHVVDPRTGRPVRTWASATVTGPSLLWADVYATAALVAGPAAPTWLAGLHGYAALLVAPDGRQHSTAGWPGSEAGG